MKNTIIKTIILISFSVFAVAFSSCRTKRQIFKFSDTKPMRAIKLYKLVEGNQLKFNTLSIKFNANIEKSGESHSLSGTIRIKKDSLIWISIVPALGIEAARMMITKDTIKFINRINSTFYNGNYSYLNNMMNLDIDFSLLQAMLTNELFLYSRQVKDDDDIIRTFRSRVDSNLYVLSSLKEKKVTRKIKKKKTNDLIFQELIILPEMFRIKEIKIVDYEYDKKFELEYSNFNKTEEYLIPQLLDFKINDSKNNINASLEYTKVTINKDLEYPFSIPEKYTRTLE